jgi:hypothetical protein
MEVSCTLSLTLPSPQGVLIRVRLSLTPPSLLFIQDVARKEGPAGGA